MFDLIAGREKHLPSHATVTAPALHVRPSSGHRADIRAPSVVHDRATAGGPDDDGVCRGHARSTSATAPATAPGGSEAEAGNAETRGRIQQNQFIAPLEEPAEIAALPKKRDPIPACPEVSRAVFRVASWVA